MSMKITGYQQSVTNVGGSGSAPRLNLSASAKAAASEAIDLSPVIKGIGDVTKTIDYINEQEDKANILAAMDSYNQNVNDLMHNETDGLMNTKEEGAAGITNKYLEGTKKIKDTVLGNTRLHFRGNQQALDNFFNKASEQGFEQVRAHQYKQGQIVQDNHLGNLKSAAFVNAGQNYNNMAALELGKAKLGIAVDLRYSEFGEERVEAERRKAYGEYGVAAMQAAMSYNDISSASNIYETYKEFMTPEQRSRFEQKAVNLQLGDKQRNIIDSMLKEGLSIDDALKRIDAMDGYEVKNLNGGGVPEQVEGTTWHKKDGVSFNGLSSKARKGLDVAAKIYSDMFGEKLLVTSGVDGKHNTHKGDDLDITDDFDSSIFSNKANRDKYIAALQAHGIKVFNEYENDSTYKTGDHLHLGFANMPEAGGTVKIPMSAKDRQDFKNMFIAAYNQNKNIQRLQDKETYNDVLNQAVEMAKAGTPIADAMQKLVFTQTGKDFTNAKSAVSLAYSGLKGAGGSALGSEYGKGSNPLVVSAIKDSFYKFDSKADVIDYAKSKHLSQSDVNKLFVAYDQYLSGEGEFAYKWNNIKERVMSDGLKGAAKEQAWAEARAAGADFIRDFQKNNKGAMPSEAEIIAACQSGKAKNFFFNYKKNGAFFSNDYKYSKGAMDQANIKEILPVSVDDNKLMVYYKNNRAELLTKEQVAEKLGGAY